MNILLADDRTRVRRALCILLEQQPEWQVVGEAADARELLILARNSAPDLILLDGELPGIFEQDAFQSIQEQCPGVCIVALVEPQPAARLRHQLNADAYVTKVNSPQYLLAVIRDCLERKA
jgi:two-component system nitrate/nitrite response regulator NarL